MANRTASKNGKKFYSLSRSDLLFVIAAMFLIGVLVGAVFSPGRIAEIRQETLEPVHVQGEKIVSLGIPAVDEEGNGVVGVVITTLRPGSGKTKVNDDNVISLPTFQQSAKLARAAAENYTRLDMSSIDIDFDVQVNASMIEGPSAGATMATAIVLMLKDVNPSDKIMMTGTIFGNTTIGPIGGIVEKAVAARDAGATTFLVPAGQGTQSLAKRTRTCEKIDGIDVCTVKYNNRPVSIGNSLNITVIEIATLADAVREYEKMSGQYQTY